MDEKRQQGWWEEGTEPHEGRHSDDLGEAGPTPIDLRDTYGNATPGLGDHRAAADLDVGERPAGPYPLPEVIERPAAAQSPAEAAAQPMADPSLSRAVDRIAAGLDPEAAGYDVSSLGPAPGPLDPPAEEEDPDAGSQPAGQWGSSG